VNFQLTCNDGTADLQLTLMKQDVEVFCGKSAVELSGLSVNEIKESLDKTVGKKLSVEVSCERLTKVKRYVIIFTLNRNNFIDFN